MRSVLLAFALVLASVLALAAARDSPLSAHEEHVGAQEEQICTGAQLDVVSRFLKLPAVPDDADRGYFNVPQGTIMAAACKRRPEQPGVTLVALAWQADKPASAADEPGTKSLLIAAMDEAQGRVLASRRETIEEDASVRVDSGSLWIDTAAYTLAPGVRAFGVDFTSGYIPHCNDGFTGAIRTLYVQEGAAIRPISAPLTISGWEILKRNDRCGNDPGPTVIEYDVASISVAPTSTNGWHDLIVTNTGTHEETGDDGKVRTKSMGRRQTRRVYIDGKYR